MIIFKEVSEDMLPQIAKLYNMLAFELKATTKDSYFDFESLSDDVVHNELQKAVQENNIKIYIALEDNLVMGFISGTIMDCFLSISSTKKIGYIEAAYVIQSHRNNKIMEKLEELLVDYFKNQGLKHIELNVLTTNLVGKHFWKKRNYNIFREQMRKQL